MQRSSRGYKETKRRLRRRRQTILDRAILQRTIPHFILFSAFSD